MFEIINMFFPLWQNSKKTKIPPLQFWIIHILAIYRDYFYTSSQYIFKWVSVKV